MNKQIVKRVFRVLLALVLMTAIALTAVDSELGNDVTPHGIVSFELCFFTSSCDSALIHWGTKGQALAMLGLGIDYLFLILYPGLIYTALLLLGSPAPDRLFRRTVCMAWLCLIISLADAIENYALIQIILNKSGSLYGLLAGIFAIIKFTLLGITLSWLLFASVRHLLYLRSKA